MIAVAQRVSDASVEVEGCVVGQISHGLCVFLGVERGDTPAVATRMAAKIAKLRVFPDQADKMNRNVQDVGGAVLLVSQFTLAGDASGGNRPSFINASPPAEAEPLYEAVVASLRTVHSLCVATGRFQTHMQVRVGNDGPVTILLRIDP